MGSNWADPVQDAAGNMTTVPNPLSLANGLTCKYDAWNRLVEVKEGESVIARYEFDGLNRQTIECPTFAPTTYYMHKFWNTSWQMLEMRTATTQNAQRGKRGQVQFAGTARRVLRTNWTCPLFPGVWSARYIDAPVLRDYAGTRYYYLGDANFSVTALINTSGDSRERYLYDPYGKVTVLNGASGDSDGSEWTADPNNASDVDNHDLFTGRWRCYKPLFYDYRNRPTSAELGRFLSRDPIGCPACSTEVNLYQYAGANPTDRTDPDGLRWETQIHFDAKCFVCCMVDAFNPAGAPVGEVCLATCRLCSLTRVPHVCGACAACAGGYSGYCIAQCTTIDRVWVPDLIRCTASSLVRRGSERPGLASCAFRCTDGTTIYRGEFPLTFAGAQKCLQQGTIIKP